MDGTDLQDEALQHALILVTVLAEVLDLGLRLIKNGVEVLGPRSENLETRLVESG